MVSSSTAAVGLFQSNLQAGNITFLQGFIQRRRKTSSSNCGGVIGKGGGRVGASGWCGTGLSDMAQFVVGQHAAIIASQRVRHECHARIVAALGDNLGFLAGAVDRAARCQN